MSLFNNFLWINSLISKMVFPVQKSHVLTHEEFESIHLFRGMERKTDIEYKQKVLDNNYNLGGTLHSFSNTQDTDKTLIFCPPNGMVFDDVKMIHNLLIAFFNLKSNVGHIFHRIILYSYPNSNLTRQVVKDESTKAAKKFPEYKPQDGEVIYNQNGKKIGKVRKYTPTNNDQLKSYIDFAITSNGLENSLNKDLLLVIKNNEIVGLIISNKFYMLVQHIDILNSHDIALDPSYNLPNVDINSLDSYNNEKAMDLFLSTRMWESYAAKKCGKGLQQRVGSIEQTESAYKNRTLIKSEKVLTNEIKKFFKDTKKRESIGIKEDEELFFYGCSLGGYPATYLAGKIPKSSLIADRTFSSTDKWMRSFFRPYKRTSLLWKNGHRGWAILCGTMSFIFLIPRLIIIIIPYGLKKLNSNFKMKNSTNIKDVTNGLVIDVTTESNSTNNNQDKGELTRDAIIHDSQLGKSGQATSNENVTFCKVTYRTKSSFWSLSHNAHWAKRDELKLANDETKSSLDVIGEFANAPRP